MDRRKFLSTSGILGAGLLGAGNPASSLLDARPGSDFESHLNLEDKPVAFTVPPLPYPNDALEPYIDARTMEIHHDKHHGAYVTNLNKALEAHPEDPGQRPGKYPRRGAQQRRGPLEPFAVLAVDEKGWRRRAEGRLGRGN